jgi:hypothetical protein
MGGERARRAAGLRIRTTAAGCELIFLFQVASEGRFGPHDLCKAHLAYFVSTMSQLRNESEGQGRHECA